MADLTKFEGWDLEVVDGEPRVRDLDIATHAGLKRTRGIRDVIKANMEELSEYGDLRGRRRQNTESHGKGRPETEYWLTEDQAVAIIAMLRTDVARQLRVALVKLFGAWRRGQLAPPTTIALDVVHGPRVGDVPALKDEVSNMCAAIAKATRISLRRVHGWIRRTFKVPGIHHIGVVLWPTVKDLLFQLLLGKLTIGPTRPQLAPGASRQLRLFQGGAS